jgi:hypothetical protein
MPGPLNGLTPSGFSIKITHLPMVDSRLVVVMGRDFVSALQPCGFLYYPRMKANVTEWASEIG